MNYQYVFKKVGEKILRIRKNKNISQENLAFDCHIDRSFLSEIEKEKTNPSLKILFKISMGLNIKLYQLFY
jgi:transcriptional regulator with XRE-family HTH domain